MRDSLLKCLLIFYMLINPYVEIISQSLDPEILNSKEYEDLLKMFNEYYVINHCPFLPRETPGDCERDAEVRLRLRRAPELQVSPDLLSRGWDGDGMCDLSGRGATRVPPPAAGAGGLRLCMVFGRLDPQIESL